MNDSCETCLYWNANGKEPSNDGIDWFVAECRRYPPIAEPHYIFLDTERMNYPGAEVGAETSRFIWPITCGFDWCGEYKSMTKKDK